ncbi:MAG: hypothetical protein ACI9LY_003990 [Arenicella sp.]|jgi:hypothetical protein
MTFSTSLLKLPLVLLMFLAVSIQAAEKTPAWLQPEVIKAAIAIQMNEEQAPQFKVAISDYLNGLTAAINKITTGTDTTNIERRIKRKNKILLKKMDKVMAGFLNPDQIPSYENYRNLLREAL